MQPDGDMHACMPNSGLQVFTMRKGLDVCAIADSDIAIAISEVQQFTGT